MITAIVSALASEKCTEALFLRGFSVLRCPKGPQDAPLCHHPDMQLARLGADIFCSEDFFLTGADFFSALTKKPRVLPDAAGARYPEDCAYNLLVMGNAFFYNPKSIAPALLQAAKARGFHAYPTKQGYAACTVCPLGAHHAITADAGMAKVLSAAGIEVLRIGAEGIALSPYEHGFIGGAGGIYKDTVYFYGDISRHPDYQKMNAFAKAAGYTLVSLSEEPLSDLGGILFIE